MFFKKKKLSEIETPTIPEEPSEGDIRIAKISSVSIVTGKILKEEYCLQIFSKEREVVWPTANCTTPITREKEDGKLLWNPYYLSNRYLRSRFESFEGAIEEYEKVTARSFVDVKLYNSKAKEQK